MLQKAQDNAPQGAPAPRADPSSPPKPPAGSQGVLSGLQALAPGLLGFDPAHLVDQLATLVSGDPAALLRMVAGDLADGYADVVHGLDASIDIPFLSALYRWITGDDLSLLDLIALVLAVPVHLAYAVFTVATTGSMREFGRDAEGLAAAMQPAPALGVGGTDDADTALGAAGPAPGPAAEPYPSAEFAFTVLRVIYAGLAAASDLLFVPQAAAGGAPAAGIGWERPLVKLLKGITGVASGVLLFRVCVPRWRERVESVVGHAHPDREAIITSVVGVPWISFAAGAAADVVGLVGGGRGLWRSFRNQAAGDDGAEFAGLVGLIFLLIPSMVLTVFRLEEGQAALGRIGAPSAVREQHRLLAVRSILMSCPALFGPFYTTTAAKIVGESGPEAAVATYLAIASLRTAAQAAAIGVDLAALYYSQEAVAPVRP